MLEMLGLRLGRNVVVALAIAALLMTAGVAFYAGMSEIAAMETRAAETARQLRDAHWKAEIAKSNAEAERRRADQAAAAATIEAATSAEIVRLRTTLSDLEATNARLPGGDRCGLSRERLRLLPD